MKNIGTYFFILVYTYLFWLVRLQVQFSPLAKLLPIIMFYILPLKPFTLIIS